MSAKWEYLYEPFSRPYAQFTEHFNAHLNGRAAEGWDLVSAQTGFEGPEGMGSANLATERRGLTRGDSPYACRRIGLASACPR